MTTPGPQTRSLTIPAPVGGWNSRSPKDDMAPTDALILKNWYPKTQEVETRKGYRLHSSGMGTKGVETLAEFNTKAGVKKLIAGANGNLYDATSLAGTASSLASSFNSNRWQTCQFNNRLILVNGEDAPQSYDGSSISAAGFTGPSTVADLIHVSSFKDRLYFCEKASTKLWVAGPGAVTGACTSYELGYYLTQGGYPLFTTQWSQVTGDGQENQFVVVGSEGDILIFTGDNPNAGGVWSLSRRAVIPKPFGRRSYIRIGADIIIATKSGIIRLADYMQGKPQGTLQRLEDRIDSEYRKFVEGYGENEGWELAYFASEAMLVINVPIVEGTSSVDPESIQIVYNLQNGAPAHFTGKNAACLGTYKDKVYFGGGGGRAFEFYHGSSDNGAKINTDLLTSFQYYGDRSSFKRILAFKPLLLATNDVDISMSIDNDFVNYSVDDIIAIDVRKTDYGSPYGSAYSDKDELINEFFSVTATGKNAAIRLQTSSNKAQVSVTSFEIIYDAGGVM